MGQSGVISSIGDWTIFCVWPILEGELDTMGDTRPELCRRAPPDINMSGWDACLDMIAADYYYNCITHSWLVIP